MVEYLQGEGSVGVGGRDPFPVGCAEQRLDKMVGAEGGFLREMLWCEEVALEYSAILAWDLVPRKL